MTGFGEAECSLFAAALWVPSAPWVGVGGLAVFLALGLFGFLRTGLSKRTSLPSLDFPVWDSGNSWDSLNAVFLVTLKQGEAAIEWYRDNIRAKRAGSRILRSIAIVLASIGALLPLVIAAASRFGESETRLKALIDAQWGYIAFATAAACVAADKFYGFSSGWIRYMKTQLALEGALTDLRYDWIALVAKLPNQQATADQVQLMLQRLKDFVKFVRAQVEQETDAWVLEFQSNLADLAHTVKSKAEAVRPGSLQVTVSNAQDFDGGIKAILDHADERSIEGAQCLFSAIPPGAHEILVRGKKADRTFETATVVKIGPDSLASLNLAVPVS
jgi:hypothetical protein